jgi:hypothetical protein
MATPLRSLDVRALLSKGDDPVAVEFLASVFDEGVDAADAHDLLALIGVANVALYIANDPHANQTPETTSCAVGLANYLVEQFKQLAGDIVGARLDEDC